MSLKTAPMEFKIGLLNGLGFGVDSKGYVVGQDGRRVLDPYINEEVKVNDMAILPGSTIILNDNPISIAGYMDQYGDI